MLFVRSISSGDALITDKITFVCNITKATLERSKFLYLQYVRDIIRYVDRTITRI